MQKGITAAGGNGLREFRPAENVSVFSIDRGGQCEHIDFCGAEKGAFGHAICFQGSADNTRCIKNNQPSSLTITSLGVIGGKLGVDFHLAQPGRSRVLL